MVSLSSRLLNTGKTNLKSPELLYDKFFKNFINGNFLNQNGIEEINVLNPSNNKIIGKIRSSTFSDVNEAVKCSKKAFNTFSKTTYIERSEMLKNIANIIRNNQEELSEIETIDTGKIISETKADVISAADCFDFFAACSLTLKDDLIPISNTSHALAVKEPLGVCVGIGVWNFPIANAAWKIAPALCMGNSFIFKPSSITPISATILAYLSQKAGLPSGVLNIVHGGSETGKYLCQHSDVSKVSFTGSVETGKKVLALCSDPIKRVSLELGGKSPLIIFDDADIGNAVKGAILANYTIQGQVCSNATRVFVHKKIYSDFRDQLCQKVKTIKVGDPLDSSTESGAIISAHHYEKILGYIDRAKSEGASVICGGERVTPNDPSLSQGLYMSPCILENCNDEMEISKEEVFGPVMCLYPFSTESEVIERANNTSFGLAAGVYSRNLSCIHRITKALDASIVYANTYNAYPVNVPFGGRKQSGYGKENGLAALQSYYDLKTIIIETGDTPEPFT